jgi:hypothetical protein
LINTDLMKLAAWIAAHNATSGHTHLIWIRDMLQGEAYARVMKTCITLLLVLMLASCGRQEPAAPAIPSAADTHDTAALHDAHSEHATTDGPTLPSGRKWATDEPLRQAMSRIRAAVEPIAAAYAHKQLSASDAQVFASLIEENVAFMVANRKLEPQADAALHVIIGHLLNAAASLKKDSAADAGVPQLVGALHEYEGTFDHPGWPALLAH